ncbi:MAG: type II toxin-antitoxin system HipA family toxin [Parasulfuritortus sp.]|nr:type II toxin-antitoxin system HipA family toxin [Parasulfuritortus sp.]
MRLDAWLTLPDGGSRRVGEIAFSDADQQGRYASAFRYTAEWLSDGDVFPIDPANLPLASKEYQAERLTPPLMALEDALPDAWGRRLLILRDELPRNRQNEPHLLHSLAGRGLGALSFFLPGQAPEKDDADADIVELDTLSDSAAALEAGREIDTRMRILLAAGSSPGGARPKALIQDGDSHWIAKFASRRDEVDEVGLETTALALARQAGLDVPDFRFAPLAGGRRALLVRRFDLTPQGRRHMLSFRSLLAADGYYVLSYADLIAALRKHSSRPEFDVPALFRQTVFNALIGNTDDHLKNFWLLHDAAGYRLTPTFDLLPDVGARREHVLIFDLAPTPPGPAGLAALGRKWGVSGSAAIVENVVAALAGFAETASKYGVPEPEIAHFDLDIARRLTKE